MEQESTAYRGIFKATFLFGSVQVFTILIKVIQNKVIALLLGTSGIGIIGLFTSSYTMLQAAAGLGINQSSVRYLSETKEQGDDKNVSRTISIIRRLLWFTSLLGAIITVVFSRKLSTWTFGDESYAFSYVLLSIVVFFNIYNLGQLAILQGMRMLKYLAKSSVLSVLAGLIVTVPLIYFYAEDGIVPSLILTGLSSVIISKIYLNKIRIEKEDISIKESISSSIGMIKLGVSLMTMSLVVSGAGLILRVFISNQGNVEQVGIFQAGNTIIHSYFGMIFTAMTKDYFPRLSAVNKNNTMVSNAVNQQAIVAILLIGPLVVLLIFLSPQMIKILYTENFIEATKYLKYGIFGVFFMAGAQTMGLSLIAKSRSDIFIISVLVLQTIFLGNNILFYSLIGIKGLGISFAINMLFDFVFIQIIVKRFFRICYKVLFFKIFIINFVLALLALYFSNIENSLIKYCFGILILFVNMYINIQYIKKTLNIPSVIKYLQNRFKT